MKKKQASSFYPYFAKDEKTTVDQMVGFFNNFVYKRQPILTDFLNPGQRDILRTVVGNEFSLQEFGGYNQAEKKRIYLSEVSEKIPIFAYRIAAFEIKYPSKFVKLAHSSILGTLANSGIESGTFGDIITNEAGTWQFFVKAELKEFFLEQITKIGRSQVKLKEISFDDILIPEDDSVTVNAVFASLRIDALLAEISKKSRSQIKLAFAQDFVKLNWHSSKSSNIIVKVNDVLSLRHFGRIKVINIKTTRKGKYRVVLQLWQTRKHR